MPELPEVETVRRGLAPVMEGARFVEVVANRGDLRWPLPKDFAQRLKGQTVTGLGRRAKYLLADLSSGDVLVMHLGMSGSFRVAREAAQWRRRARTTTTAPRIWRTTTSCSACRRARPIRFNDPRRFGSMKLVPRAKLDEEPLLRELGPEPLGNEFDAAMLAQACQGKNTSLKAALLDQTRRRRARQHLCVRGAQPGAAVAQAQGLDHRRSPRRAERARGAAGGCDQGGAQRRHRGRRLVAARPSPHRRLARRLPAQLPRL